MFKGLKALLIVVLLACPVFGQTEVPLDEVVPFDCDTRSPSTLGQSAADSTPTYKVFEETTDTPILTGSFTARSGLTGEYRATATMSAGNGAELGKFYLIKCYATVEGVSDHKIVAYFRIKATEDAVGYVKGTIKDGTGTGEIDTNAGAVAHVVLADTITTYTGNTPQTGNVYPLVDTEVGAIKTKTDFLPSATAGTTNGLFIAGTNAATTITTGLTTHFIGTVDTVTNLTNAPTSGDLTATMKTSVTTAATAATPTVTTAAMTAAALKDFFDTDTTVTYPSGCVSGSVVCEITDNAGGSALTVPDIVDGILDEALSPTHLMAGTVGKSINDAAAVNNPLDELTADHTTAGTYGKLFTDNLNATVSSRASQSSLDTVDDYVDSEVGAIKTKTDSLTFTVSNKVDANIYTWNGTIVATPDTAGYPKVTIKDGTGTGEIDTATGGVTLKDDAITAAKVAAGAITSSEAPALANLDTTVSSRGTFSAKKQTSFKWPLTFISSTDGTAVPSAAITCQRSIDSISAFATGTLSLTAANTSSLGLGEVTVGTADMNGDHYMYLRCQVSGADIESYTFKIEQP